MRLAVEAGPDTLSVATDLGIKGVPIDAQALVEQGTEAVVGPLLELGLSVCQIGAFGYNPLTRDRAEYERQVRIVKEAIPMAASVGCAYIVFGGGNYHPNAFGAMDARNFTEVALDDVARALEPLLDLAERHGVKLTIEPYLKSAVGTPERFLELHRRVRSDALRVNVDVTNFYTFPDMLAPEPTIRRTCTLLAGHYGLCHIKEVALAEGFHLHMDLAPVGEGPTDWALVLELVEPHLPGDSWVMVEHIATPEEAEQSVGLIRNAARKANVSLMDDGLRSRSEHHACGRSTPYGLPATQHKSSHGAS